MDACQGRCGGEPPVERRAPRVRGAGTGPLGPAVVRRTVARRTVAAAAGVAAAGLLAACAGNGGASATTDDDATGDAGATPGGALARVLLAEVPEGGGVVLAEPPVVVTQPEAGTFAAFGATCPHQGCPVTRVDASGIICPCHSSIFDIADGHVVGGPAQQGLPVLTATVEGDEIVVSGA